MERVLTFILPFLVLTIVTAQIFTNPGDISSTTTENTVTNPPETTIPPFVTCEVENLSFNENNQLTWEPPQCRSENIRYLVETMDWDDQSVAPFETITMNTTFPVSFEMVPLYDKGNGKVTVNFTGFQFTSFGVSVNFTMNDLFCDVESLKFDEKNLLTWKAPSQCGGEAPKYLVQVKDLDDLSVEPFKTLTMNSSFSVTFEMVPFNHTGNGKVTVNSTNLQYISQGVSINFTMERSFCDVENLKFGLKNKLTWTAPTDCDGFKTYFVEIQALDMSFETIRNFTDNLEFAVDLEMVPLGSKANGTVTVILDETSSSISLGVSTIFTMEGAIPEVPTNEAEENVIIEQLEKHPDSGLVISWPEDLFSNASGKIEQLAILVRRGYANDDEESRNGFNVAEPVALTWISSRQGIKDWYKNEIISLRETFIVGDEQCEVKGDKNIVCNGALLPQTYYCLKIRAYNKVAYVDSRLHCSRTSVPPVDAAGSLIVSFMVLAMIGAIMFSLLFTRRLTIRMRTKVLDINLDDQPAEAQSKSINKFEFAKHFENLLLVDRETNATDLSDQFEQLALLSPPPPSTHPENYSAAGQQFNRRKNRYINILPYDSTRVVLSVVSPNDPESDYINASYIKGATGQVEYIGCQGPLSDTTEDFWRMVFEKDVCVICMVTHLEEKGKTKCHKYFPEMMETMRYERISVKCIAEEQCSGHTRRTFILQESNGAVLKTVVQLQFREWPDFGCPESTDLLIEFCKSLRDCASKCNDGLVLVHCSAGVGRTGTLIALDILMQEAKKSKMINVFDTVLNLRFQRINMVQTEDQYKYIHECLRDVLQREEYLDSKVAVYRKLEPVYATINKKTKPDRQSVKVANNTARSVFHPYADQEMELEVEVHLKSSTCSIDWTTDCEAKCEEMKSNHQESKFPVATIEEHILESTKL